MGFPQRTPVLLAVLAATLLLAPAGAQQTNAPGPVELPVSPKQPVTVTPAAQDAEIAERLTRIMLATGWFAAPRVSVRDGVVFLDGATETADYRDWAGDLAQNTEGAVAVVNRIKVEADIGTTFGRAADEATRLYRRAVEAWPLAVLVAVILFATWALAKLVGMAARRFFTGRIPSPLLFSIVVRAFTIPVFLLGLYFVLQVAGLTRLALTVLGGTGLAGIILGFAFRDIAENFLASLLLSVRNPFSGGDLIEVAGHTGIVQNLNTRSTVLLTLDGNHVQIPNATVYKSTIKNYSSIPSRRAEFVVGIAYDSSATRAQSLIADILKEHPAVLNAPEPLVLVDELGAATVNLRVTYWFDSATYSPAKINSALMRLTKNCLLKNGVELPDAAREVIFPKGIPLASLPQASAAAPAAAEREAPFEEAGAATEAEGDLTSESTDMRAQPDGGAVPEATENLLKQRK
jgi:small conductance mechanosensitive channel